MLKHLLGEESDRPMVFTGLHPIPEIGYDLFALVQMLPVELTTMHREIETSNHRNNQRPTDTAY
jgi:hypothetical protein